MTRAEYVKKLEELAMHLRNAQRAITDESRVKYLADLHFQAKCLAAAVRQTPTEEE